MKNWKRYLAIALMICFAVTIVPSKAHADALGAGLIGNAIMGIASSLGVTWTITNNTAAFTTAWIESEINQYDNKQPLMDSFMGDGIRIIAGRLAIAQQAYNNALEFLGHIKQKYNDPGTLIGTNGQVFDPNGMAGQLNGWAPYPGGSVNASGFFMEGWSKDGAAPSYASVSSNTFEYVGMSVNYLSSQGTVYYYYQTISVPHSNKTTSFNKSYASMGVYNTQNANFDFTNYGDPQPLPSNRGWEGDFSKTPGWAEPQDLPDFLSRIPSAIANNDLVVEGEIVDTESGGPTPPPSSSPSPTPSGPTLGIKEKLAILIGEIIGILYDTSGDTAQETIEQVADGIDEVTQTITDAITETQISTSTQTQDAIQEQTQTITDTITQTQTQTQTEIQDATQTITDTITDTQTDIKDAIQDQTQPMIDTMEDIKEKLDDITEVPDDFAPQKHPLPRGVFPFCIPFDLHDLILALSAAPQTPEIHVPFDLNLPLPGGNVLLFHYQFDLDLHDFDGLAAVLRTLEFVAFGVGLLFVTGKVIKW